MPELLLHYYHYTYFIGNRIHITVHWYMKRMRSMPCSKRLKRHRSGIPLLSGGGARTYTCTLSSLSCLLLLLSVPVDYIANLQVSCIIDIRAQGNMVAS